MSWNSWLNMKFLFHLTLQWIFEFKKFCYLIHKQNNSSTYLSSYLTETIRISAMYLQQDWCLRSFYHMICSFCLCDPPRIGNVCDLITEGLPLMIPIPLEVGRIQHSAYNSFLALHYKNDSLVVIIVVLFCYSCNFWTLLSIGYFVIYSRENKYLTNYLNFSSENIVYHVSIILKTSLYNQDPFDA